MSTSAKRSTHAKPAPAKASEALQDTRPATEQAPANPPKAKSPGKFAGWRKTGLPGNEAVITVLVSSNPKRANKKSAPRFDIYRTGMTVAEMRAEYEKRGFKGFATPDLKWDIAHNFISVQ